MEDLQLELANDEHQIEYPAMMLFKSFANYSTETQSDQSSYNDNLIGFNLSIESLYNIDPKLVQNLIDVAYNIISRFPILFYMVWPSDTMFESIDQVPRFVTEVFPVLVISAVLENLIRMLQGRYPLRVNESIASLSAGVFQECFRIKVRSIEVLMYCLIWKHFRLVTLPWNSLWTWWICYIGVDLGFYWAHRLAHEVNFIWAIHQAHHSSVEFSMMSALRQAVLQPFTAWITYAPLALIVPPQIYLAHLQLSELFMAWLHTEVIDTLGPLEYILNTPSHHRVHHSRNPEYIDKNYGGMLIIWDRLLGTFKAEDKNNPPVYGLVHPIESFEPFYVQFHTWPVIWKRLKTSKSITDRFKVLFYGPGWQPGTNDRLGDHSKLPKIVRPVYQYNPQIRFWKNTYAVIHFALVLFFYHELSLYHDHFNPLTLNIGVISLIVSITSLGILLDNRRKYNSLYELLRCLMFFQASNIISDIFDQGFKRTGFNVQFRALIILAIHSIFLLSVLINVLNLVVVLTLDYRDQFINTLRMKRTKKIE